MTKDYSFRYTEPSCLYNEKNARYMENFSNNDTISKNYNHKEGRLLLTLILLFIMVLIIYLTTKDKYLLYSTITLFISLIIYIISKPIRLMYMISFIIAKDNVTDPFLNKDIYFPNYERFEGNFDMIKKEIFDQISDEEILNKLLVTTGSTYMNDMIGIDDGWRIIPVKVGNVYKDNIRDYFPQICQILDECPEIVSCLISVLGPGKQIPIHVGYHKGFVRYQLAVEIPEDGETVPFMCVNGEKHTWVEGQGFLFDDTFPHKVYNPTTNRRIVFYMDVVRNCNSDIIDKINKMFVYNVMNMGFIKKIIKKEVNNTEVQI